MAEVVGRTTSLSQGMSRSKSWEYEELPYTGRHEFVERPGSMQGLGHSRSSTLSTRGPLAKVWYVVKHFELNAETQRR